MAQITVGNIKTGAKVTKEVSSVGLGTAVGVVIGLACVGFMDVVQNVRKIFGAK